MLTTHEPPRLEDVVRCVFQMRLALRDMREALLGDPPAPKQEDGDAASEPIQRRAG